MGRRWIFQKQKKSDDCGVCMYVHLFLRNKNCNHLIFFLPICPLETSLTSLRHHEKGPFSQPLALFRIPATVWKPFCTANGDSLFRGFSSLADDRITNLGQLLFGQGQPNYPSKRSPSQRDVLAPTGSSHWVPQFPGSLFHPTRAAMHGKRVGVSETI